MRRLWMLPMLAVAAVTLGACGSSCGTRCGNAGPSAVRAQSGATSATPAAPTTATQSPSAADLAAQSLARTAQTAAETLATDDNGNYSRISTKAIAMLEPNIPLTPSPKGYLSAVRGTNTTYSVTATSASGDTFTISRDARGHISRRCTGHASPACHGGSW